MAYIQVSPTLRDGHTERGDCSVIALSTALSVPYYEAYGLLQRFGRRKNTGFRLHQFLRRRNYLLGHDIEHILVSIYGGPISRMQFCKQEPKGTFICCSSGHAFVIRDGILFDTFQHNRRIRHLFKVHQRIIPGVIHSPS